MIFSALLRSSNSATNFSHPMRRLPEGATYNGTAIPGTVHFLDITQSECDMRLDRPRIPLVAEADWPEEITKLLQPNIEQGTGYNISPVYTISGSTL